MCASLRCKCWFRAVAGSSAWRHPSRCPPQSRCVDVFSNLAAIMLFRFIMLQIHLLWASPNRHKQGCRIWNAVNASEHFASICVTLTYSNIISGLTHRSVRAESTSIISPRQHLLVQPMLQPSCDSLRQDTAEFCPRAGGMRWLSVMHQVCTNCRKEQQDHE